MKTEKTADPEVVIESRKGDEIVYRRSDGLRWKVKGVCDRRGDCMIGAVVLDGVVIKDKKHLAQLVKKHGTRIDSLMDVPVGPNFSGCCPFKITRLKSKS